MDCFFPDDGKQTYVSTFHIIFIPGAPHLRLSSLNPLLMYVGFPHVGLLQGIHEQVYTCVLATHT